MFSTYWVLWIYSYGIWMTCCKGLEILCQIILLCQTAIVMGWRLMIVSQNLLKVHPVSFMYLQYWLLSTIFASSLLIIYYWRMLVLHELYWTVQGRQVSSGYNMGNFISWFFQDLFISNTGNLHFSHHTWQYPSWGLGHWLIYNCLCIHDVTLSSMSICSWLSDALYLKSEYSTIHLLVNNMFGL